MPLVHELCTVLLCAALCLLKRPCWSCSGAGGLVDGALASASADCITSVVLGKDWVPRLSLSSFERLRDEMVRPLRPYHLKR